MNVPFRDGPASTRRPSMPRAIAPVLLALLAGLPMSAPARTYWSINIGTAYPAYPVYPVYRRYPVYRAYAYPVPMYPVYRAYPAYPVYSGYDEPAPYWHRTWHRHRHVSVASSSVSVSAQASHAAPPPLPAETQPPIPGDGYIWTPGYWSYASDDYVWVPGEWVLAPYPGALWTPPWWGWGNGYYAFHPGYWGLHVGYYGGINYGFGYFGVGYLGGYWNDGAFFYNRAVNNIAFVSVRNVYNFPWVNVWAHRGTRVSFNGGPGGIRMQPTSAERAVAQQRHTPPVPAQQRQVQMASRNRAMFASFNHGSPPPAAANRSSRMIHDAGVATSREPARAWRDGPAHAGMPRRDDLGPRRDGAPSPMAFHRGEPMQERPAAAPPDRELRRDYAGHFAGPPREPSGRPVERDARNPRQ